MKTLTDTIKEIRTVIASARVIESNSAIKSKAALAGGKEGV